MPPPWWCRLPAQEVVFAGEGRKDTCPVFCIQKRRKQIERNKRRRRNKTLQRTNFKELNWTNEIRFKSIVNNTSKRKTLPSVSDNGNKQREKRRVRHKTSLGQRDGRPGVRAQAPSWRTKYMEPKGTFRPITMDVHYARNCPCGCICNKKKHNVWDQVLRRRTRHRRQVGTDKAATAVTALCCSTRRPLQAFWVCTLP